VTDRRRNLFVLLLVAGLLAASIAVIATKETKLGLDLRGGVELIYEASPTPQQPVVDQQALDRAIDVMRERVDALGVSEPEIQRSGENQISVGLPDVTNADEAQQQVGQVAQLFFYDWEPNVIGPDGRAEPQNPSVTGGSAAGQPTDAALSKFEAVNRAAERPEINDGNNTHEGLFYAVQPSDREVVAGPEDSREDLQEDIAELPARQREGTEIREVKQGTVLVQAEQPDDVPENQQSDEWFVLADNVALRGTDVKNPEQNFDQGAGGSGSRSSPSSSPSAAGASGARRPGRSPSAASASRSRHLGPGGRPALRDRPRRRAHLGPFIDFVQNPNGIDASTGSQIEGGFTIESAQELSNLLKTGALPVKLELISQSQVSATLGQQSLDQGLLAGIGGFVIVALFLLIFYRILGVIAVTALCVYAPSFFALIKLDPDHADAAGHRGPDPHDRASRPTRTSSSSSASRRRSERADRSAPASRRATRRASRDHRRERRHDPGGVHPVRARDLGRQGLRLVLGVGTIVSLFTAVLFTQAIVGTLGRSKLLAQPSALGAGKPKRPITIDFVGLSKWFFSASGVILLICALAIGGKGIDLGIDFESGTRVRAAIDRPTNEDGIRAAIASTPAADAEIQRVEEPELGANVFQVSPRSCARTRSPRSPTRSTSASGCAASRTRPRSGRRSATRWPRARSSRSSPR
jgi:SecD/SecF fusion protein